MPEIIVDGRRFKFPELWKVEKYDDWSFYRNQFQSVCGGTKAIDLIALDSSSCSWLIEAKNYQLQRRTKPSELPEEIATKVRDTLAGLVAAKANAPESSEKSFATAAIRCRKLRIALHLEQPAKHSKLFPRAIDPADVLQRMKQLLKAIDPHPLAVDSNAGSQVVWSVQPA